MVRVVFTGYSSSAGNGMNNNEALLKRISELESLNDQLMAELKYLDQLMRQIGFENGLKTLKFAALEILEHDKPQEENLG